MKAGVLIFYARKLKTVVPVGIWAVVWGGSISILIFVGEADWTYGSSPMISKIKLLRAAPRKHQLHVEIVKK